VGEVLAGEVDVKKDERWGLRGAWVVPAVSAEVRVLSVCW